MVILKKTTLHMKDLNYKTKKTKQQKLRHTHLILKYKTFLKD
jgi:hypothetical protein